MEESVRRALRDKFQLGSVNPAWLRTIIESLRNSGSSADLSSRVCELVLTSNIRDCCTGCLPANLLSIRDQILQGPFFLQLDELVNIGVPIEKRYTTSDDSKMRTFKLCLHDGAQQVFAIEWQKVPQLSVNTSPGTKLIISNVRVRRGLILLAPENLRIIGGSVDALIAASLAQRKKTEKSLIPEEWSAELGQMNLSEQDIVPPDLAPQRPQPQPQPLLPQPQPREPVVANPIAPRPQPQAAPVVQHKQDDEIYIDEELDDLLATIELPQTRPVSLSSINSSAAASNRFAPNSSSLSNSFLPPSKRQKAEESSSVVLDLLDVSVEAISTSSPQELAKYEKPRHINNVAQQPFHPRISSSMANPPPPQPAAPETKDPHPEVLNIEIDGLDEEPTNHSQCYPDNDYGYLPDTHIDLVDEPAPPPENDNMYDYNGDDDIFADPSALAAMDNAEKQYASRLSEPPFSYLADILDTTFAEPVVKRICGSIIATLGELEVKRDRYSLTVTIVDGTSKINAAVADIVLEGMIGLPAVDFAPFYYSELEDQREIAQSMLRVCEDGLRAACGSMLILFGSPDVAYPIITSLEQTALDVIDDCRRFMAVLTR